MTGWLGNAISHENRRRWCEEEADRARSGGNLELERTMRAAAKRAEEDRDAEQRAEEMGQLSRRARRGFWI